MYIYVHTLILSIFNGHFRKLNSWYLPYTEKNDLFKAERRRFQGRFLFLCPEEWYSSSIKRILKVGPFEMRSAGAKKGRATAATDCWSLLVKTPRELYIPCI